jgi:hypothetical protein
MSASINGFYEDETRVMLAGQEAEAALGHILV